MSLAQREPLLHGRTQPTAQGRVADEQERLRGLVGKAIDILEQALQPDDVKAAVTALRAANLYGNVGALLGGTDPELVLLAQAEAWAAQELWRQGPQDDPLALLVYDGAKARLTRQRLEELRHAYLTETSDKTPQG